MINSYKPLNIGGFRSHLFPSRTGSKLALYISMVHITTFLNSSRLIKSSITYLFFNGLEKVIPFFLLPVITRYLSPTEFGIFTTYIIAVSTLSIILPLNSTSILKVNYFNSTKEDFVRSINSVIHITFIIYAIFSIILIYLKNTISKLTGFPIEWIIFAPTLSLINVIISITIIAWQVEDKAKQLGSFNLFKECINMSFAIYLMVILSMGLEGRFMSYIISMLAAGLISIFILYKKKLLLFQFSRKYIKDALNYGMPLIPHTISLWSKQWVDRIIITTLLGFEAVGIYSLAHQMASVISMVLNAVNNAFVPFFYQKINNNGIRFKIEVVKNSYFIMLFFLIISIGWGLTANLFLELLVGDKFKQAFQFVFILSLGILFQGCYLLVVKYFHHTKKTKLLSMITSSVMILNIIISYVLCNLFGMAGVTYSFLLSNLLVFSSTWYYSIRIFPMPWNIMNHKNQVLG